MNEENNEDQQTVEMNEEQPVEKRIFSPTSRFLYGKESRRRLDIVGKRADSSCKVCPKREANPEENTIEMNEEQPEEKRILSPIEKRILYGKESRRRPDIVGKRADSSCKVNPEEKTIKFGEDTKPPYNGKIKAPNRLSETGDAWYMIVGDGQKDGPFTTEYMRGYFEADIIDEDCLCTNEGIDGNYYKVGLLFYPNVRDAFIPDGYNPLVNLDHRTAAASAEISRLTQKNEWNKAADGVIVKLPNTDTDPVEGDKELEWFLHHGNPKWRAKNGDTIKFGDAVRRDFIMIGDNITMFEFRKLDPRMYPHSGDGIMRIKMKGRECTINGMKTTVCVKEVMIFQMHGTLYKLYPALNGSNRYLIMCNGPDVVEVIFFAPMSTSRVEQPSIYRPRPGYAGLVQMKYRPASELLTFNYESIKDVRVFSETTTDKRSLLKVIDDQDSLTTILTHGKYWRLTDWEDNRQIHMLLTPEGNVTDESAEIIGTWRIEKEGSFALYQDKRDWHTIYRKKVRRRVRLEMTGGFMHNMYVLQDTTTSLYYLQEELAYFQIIDGKVTMADISGRKACEAIRVV